MVLTAAQVASVEAPQNEAAIIIPLILRLTGVVTTALIEWPSMSASNSSAKPVEPIL